MSVTVLWGRAWLGESSTPHSTEQGHLVAGLESPGQLHSNAWGPGGALEGSARGPLPFQAVSGPLHIPKVSPGNQTSYGVAQGATSKPRFPETEVEVASVLRHSIASAILCWSDCQRAHPGSREGTHLAMRGMSENLWPSLTYHRNSLSTFRLFSVCTKYTDISKETLYILLT